jgi:GDPmannose 4,6-dehydratase
MGVAAIKAGKQKSIVLGNLDASRDWGFAGDYVEGMKLMLRQDKPDDYLLATGEPHSIREFAEEAFRAAGMEIVWRGSGVDEKGVNAKTGETLVEVSPEFYRPAEVDMLVGDPSKAMKHLGWQPKVKFHELARMMVENDMNTES